MSDYQHESDGLSDDAIESDQHGQNESHLATRSPPRRVGNSAQEIDLSRIADALPKLGAVLWLHRRERHGAPTRAMIGAGGVLLFDHPALAALEQCRRLTAHSAITSQGPREWLCFRDRVGVTHNKLFLLPDTDYLAWDEMVAASRLVAATQETWARPPHRAFLRRAWARIGSPWRARLLRFDLKRLPWLRTLGAQAPLRISLLGLDLARMIARAESAELVVPLHSA